MIIRDFFQKYEIFPRYFGGFWDFRKPWTFFQNSRTFSKTDFCQYCYGCGLTSPGAMWCCSNMIRTLVVLNIWYATGVPFFLTGHSTASPVAHVLHMRRFPYSCARWLRCNLSHLWDMTMWARQQQSHDKSSFKFFLSFEWWSPGTLTGVMGFLLPYLAV